MNVREFYYAAGIVITVYWQFDLSEAAYASIYSILTLICRPGKGRMQEFCHFYVFASKLPVDRSLFTGKDDLLFYTLPVSHVYYSNKQLLETDQD